MIGVYGLKYVGTVNNTSSCKLYSLRSCDQRKLDKFGQLGQGCPVTIHKLSRLENEAKLASKKLEVLNRAKPWTGLPTRKKRHNPVMEYCLHSEPDLSKY